MLAGPARRGYRVPVISSLSCWQHGVFRPQPGGLNQAGGHAARGGDHDTQRARAGLRRRLSRQVLVQATDVTVAETVEDQGEKFAGRGDASDVDASSLRDPVMMRFDRSRAALAGDGL